MLSHKHFPRLFSCDSLMPHFFSQTLQKSTAIHQAVYGNFSSPKAQELVVSRYAHSCPLSPSFFYRGKIIELLRPDNHGRIQTICSQEVYGFIRALSPFRLVGATRDYLLVGSDAGRIVVLEFDAQRNKFKKVHQETFGKTGCRRIVPGEYLAVDPQGRACMIAAIEKQKFVYILNRDLDQKLTISSPLEAHKANTIVYTLVALDVGFDNPLFASIEAFYDGKGATKLYTIYEMDLGINHVVRKYAEPLPDSAHMLIPVPGGIEGPGGCLVCCDGFVVYKRLGRESLTCQLPRRVDCPLDASVMIVSHAKHRMKDFSLLMIQSELGDLYRIDLVIKSPPNGPVESLRIAYMETIPRAVSLCIFKSGFLFAASELGAHRLYQFTPSSVLTASMKGVAAMNSSNDDPNSTCNPFMPLNQCIEPQPVYECPSLCPLIDTLPVYDQEGELKIFAASGRSLKTLKLGVPVQELAASDLPGKPSGVWTLTGNDDAQGLDKLIVISFIDATLVLSVGETVQEISDSGILGSVQTMSVERLADSSILQIHLRGLRQVHEASGRVTEWRVPGGRQVVVASTNSRQALVGLSGGELIYFELSSETGIVEEVLKREMGCEIHALSIPRVREGRMRSLFAAIGGSDRSIRILSLEPDKLLRQVSAQSFQGASVESLIVTNDGFLSVGLANGTLVRCCMDQVTGLLSDSRTKFVGVRPVRLVRVMACGKECVLVMSSRPWIIDPTSVGIVPLVYQDQTLSVTAFEFSASFNSELCPDGLVAIVGGSLRIVTGLERLGSSAFAEQSIDLNYTARKLIRIPHIDKNLATDNFVVGVVETEKDALPVSERDGLDGLGNWAGCARGRWASCVRFVDPMTLETRACIEMDSRNEAVTSACVVRFYQLRENRPCIVLSTCVDQELNPKRKASNSALKTYLYDDQFIPKLVHVTPTAEHEGGGGVPLAMAEYDGRLLVSFSGTPALLRVYELGKKKLLRKSEYRNFQCGGFTNIQVVKDRIFVADTHQSVHVLKLNKVDGQLYVICDDIVQRYMSSMLVLDYNTVIGADKFENVFVGRVPAEVREEQGGSGGASQRLGPDTSYILGKTHKLEPINQFHVGDIVTSMHKVTLAPGASEVVLYGTLSGAIGILYPFTSKREYEMLLSLESNLRCSSSDSTSLIGRDHAAFRGYYLPAKGFIDGDLIQEFFTSSDRATVAAVVGKSVGEIEKAIDEIRNRIT